MIEVICLNMVQRFLETETRLYVTLGIVKWRSWDWMFTLALVSDINTG